MEISSKHKLAKLVSMVLFNIAFSTEMEGQNYLPVHEASFHTPIFQSEGYNILNVHLLPGDTSDMHIHNTPILYISLKQSEVFIKKPTGENRLVTIPNNWIGSDSYNLSHTNVHKIAPSGNDTLNIVAFQIRQGFQVDSLSISHSESLYSENGFSVIERISIENYFRNSDIPLVVKSGELSCPGQVFVRGSLISKDVFQKWKEDFKRSQLTFWEVSFSLLRK